MVELDCRKAAHHWRTTAVVPMLAELGFSPTLATVMREGDPGAESYERALSRRCRETQAGGLSIRHQPHRVSSAEQTVALISRLNSDRNVNGILVFYPLRLGNDSLFMNAVDPHKDVEGLHAINLGYLLQFKRTLDSYDQLKLTVPCTAKAVGKLLDYQGISLRGKNVLIYNNSLILGRPLGLYLENLGSTVVRTFDQTEPAFQEHVLSNAQLIVTGVPHAVTLFDRVPEGAIVINVSGVPNFPASALQNASYFTDRIGPLTCEMAMLQTIYVARRAKAGLVPGPISSSA